MKRFRFYEFVFDCSSYELTNGDGQIPLPRLPTKLLLLLLERAGQLVTQQTLVSELWPHAGVADATPNLHAAIKRIRMALGDSPAKPAYIQTVIGVGYRFIAPLEVETLDSPSPHTTQELDQAEAPERLRSEDPAANSGYLEPVDLLIPTPVAMPPHPPQVQGAPTSPSTASASATARSEPSRNTMPTAWLLWTVAALVVMISLAWAVHAVWRSRSDAAFTFAPVLRMTSNDTDNFVSAQAISPDGKNLAFADRDGLMIEGLHDLAPTPLPFPGLQEINFLSWFPDGKRVAASGLSKGALTPQVWIVAVDSTSPPVLFRDLTPVAAVSLVTGRIAYLSGDGTEVWDADADGSEPRRLLVVEGDKTFNRITWMPDKPFLIVQAVRRLSEQELEDNPYKVPGPADTTLLVVRAQDGAVTARENGYQLIEGCALPGNRVVLAKADQERKLFTVSATFDPQSTALSKTTPIPFLLSEDQHLLTCSVASTGNVALLLWEGNGVVFVGELTGNNRDLLNAHPLTSGKNASYTHAWSADGRSVLPSSRSKANGTSSRNR